MLGEDTAQIGRAGLGGAVGLFARTSLQFLLAHGHTGSVGTDVHDGRITGTRQRRALLPGLRLGANSLHHTLNLPCRNLDACLTFFASPLRRSFGSASRFPVVVLSAE